MFYRDKSTYADLPELIVGFYSASKIAESKRVLIQEFSTHLEDCPNKTARRHSAARSAHDAEVKDILCILEIIDSGGSLDKKARFAAVLLDRIPMYGLNEINVFAVVDRQIIADQHICELKQKVVDISISQVDCASKIVESAKLVEDKMKPIIDKINDQLNTFMSTCNKLNESRRNSSNNVQPEVTVVDRSMNVVITGVTENTKDAVWREIIARALNHAAGCPIEITDAFRLGRFMAGKTRPVLVKLSSVWNRHLVITGARKLHIIDDMRKVYLSADEPFETRRQNALDRLKSRAQCEKKQIFIYSFLVK